MKQKEDMLRFLAHLIVIVSKALVTFPTAQQERNQFSHTCLFPFNFPIF